MHSNPPNSIFNCSVALSSSQDANHPEVGIYTRKQENTLSTKKAIKRKER